jgi:hypothetical protein
MVTVAVRVRPLSSVPVKVSCWEPVAAAFVNLNLNLTLDPFVTIWLSPFTLIPGGKLFGAATVTLPLKPPVLLINTITGALVPIVAVIDGSLNPSEKSDPITVTVTVIV